MNWDRHGETSRRLVSVGSKHRNGNPELVDERSGLPDLGDVWTLVSGVHSWTTT